MHLSGDGETLPQELTCYAQPIVPASDDALIELDSEPGAPETTGDGVRAVPVAAADNISLGTASSAEQSETPATLEEDLLTPSELPAVPARPEELSLREEVPPSELRAAVHRGK